LIRLLSLLISSSLAFVTLLLLRRLFIFSPRLFVSSSDKIDVTVVLWVDMDMVSSELLLLLLLLIISSSFIDDSVVLNVFKTSLSVRLVDSVVAISGVLGFS